MNYSLLKIMVLLLLSITFIGIVIWLFRPDANQLYKKISNIALRNEYSANKGDDL